MIGPMKGLRLLQRLACFGKTACRSFFETAPEGVCKVTLDLLPNHWAAVPSLRK
jgi:hypothetical protein